MKDKKYVLITGSTSGLGLELAFLYGSLGFDLILVGRNEKKLKSLKVDLTAKYPQMDVISYVCDLSNRAAYEEMTSHILKSDHIPYILINNAALGGFGATHEREIQQDFQMMEVNMNALIYLTQKLIPQMMEKEKAYILNISSAAAFVPGAFQAIYYASKAFVHSYSLALKKELQGTSISVTSFCPARFHSKFHEKAGMSLEKISAVSAQYMANSAHKALMQEKSFQIEPLKMRFLIGFLLKISPPFLVDLYLDQSLKKLLKEKS